MRQAPAGHSVGTALAQPAAAASSGETRPRRGSGVRLPTLATAMLLLGSVLTAAPARLLFVESVVERTATGDDWSPARENTAFEFGERLRVMGPGLARLRFPWMSVTLGPDAKLSLPAAGVLALQLERGRLAVDSAGREMLPVAAPEAEIRGVGRLVVRAEPGRTLVMAHSGRFEVFGAGASVTLEAGWGTLVGRGTVPAPPRKLPPPPRGLSPGEQALSVGVGQPAPLAWQGSAASHWVELLRVGGDAVLLHRDAGAGALSLRIPWSGTFRWRVASRDAEGLEGLPSADGIVRVVE